MTPAATAAGGGNTWEGTSVTAQRSEDADVEATTPMPPTQVVDVEVWLDRATEPSQVRAFTYVGKHRKEPIES